MTWRTGRSLGRTLYEMPPDATEMSKTDKFLGIMDTRELAEQVVEAVNGVRYDRVLASANERVIELEKRVDDKEEELVRLNDIAASKMAENEYLYARTVELSDTNQRIQKERDTLKSLLDADIEREQVGPVVRIEDLRVAQMELYLALKERDEAQNRISELEKEVDRRERERVILLDNIKRLELLDKTVSPAPSSDSVRREMIVELDWALHGQTYARSMAPQEVWKELLREAHQSVVFGKDGRKREKRLEERCAQRDAEIKSLKEQLQAQADHDNPVGQGIHRALAHVLNYYGVDNATGISDTKLARTIILLLDQLDRTGEAKS